MAGPFDNWLRDLAAAGKGGKRFVQLAIDRGQVWEKTLVFGTDYSADDFACNLASSPDGTTLVSPNVTVGAFGSGVTPIVISLTAVQTADPSKIPADDDGDGVEDLVFDLLRTPNGGDEYRLMAGTIPVLGVA